MNNYTLIDYFNGFALLRSRNRKLTTNDMLTYYIILDEFNKARFPEEMELSTRILQDLTGIASVATVHRAKNVLKNIGAIDFKLTNGRTVYKLKDEHLPNRRTNIRQTKGKRPANTAASSSPLILVSEDRRDCKTQTKTAPANTKGGNNYGEENGGGNRRIDWAVDPYAGLEHAGVARPSA